MFSEFLLSTLAVDDSERFPGCERVSIFVKPWPNRLVSRPKFSTRVYLRVRLPPKKKNGVKPSTTLVQKRSKLSNLYLPCSSFFVTSSLFNWPIFLLMEIAKELLMVGAHDGGGGGVGGHVTTTVYLVWKKALLHKISLSLPSCSRDKKASSFNVAACALPLQTVWPAIT